MSIPAQQPSLRWLAIGRVEDVPAQGARVVLTPDTAIAVFKTRDGRLFAIEDRCPHKGGPLSEGLVHGDCVVCPLHGLKIDLVKGSAIAPDEGSVKRYPIRQEGEQLFLGVAC